MPAKPPAESPDHSPFSRPPSIRADRPASLKDVIPEDHTDPGQLLAEPELQQLLHETGTFLYGVERFLLRVAGELTGEQHPEATLKPDGTS
jgi:hypothetical protein